jgi:Ribonuclease G/E
MKGVTIAVEALPRGGYAVARIVDGRLEDLIVDPPPGDLAPRPGAIFRAVPGRPMKGMGGIMVALGGDRTGFLREAAGIAPGKPILVQVATRAEPGKAPPVSRRLTLKGRHAILTPGAPGLNIARGIGGEGRDRLQSLADAAMAGAPDTLGLIIRSNAADAPDTDVAAEIGELRRTAAALEAGADAPALILDAPDARTEAWREWPDATQERLEPVAGAFTAHGVWEAIDALLAPRVPLAGGASLVIEPTTALVAVDVNTGADTSPAAGLKASIAAARALPRELRLRGLGGQVVIDFAPFPRKDRGAVETALKGALRDDGIETTLAGWTPLGHLELLRKRARRPLAELLSAGTLPR